MRKISFLLALAAVLCVSGCTNLPTQNSSDISEQTVQTTDIGSQNADSVGEPIGQTDIFKLLNGYLNDENYICVSFNDIPACEDYDLFRKHFFGVWNSADGYLSSDMILDDSENINFVRGYFGSFYQLSDNLLAFTVNNNAEGYLFWLETDSPDVMYSAPYYYATEGSLFSTACSTHILTKNDDAPNEPSDGFLSVFKLREMSRSRSIDYSLLTNIDGGFLDGIHLEHTATYNFFPMYLVSESEEKIVIRTSVGSVLEKDLLPLNVTCTFEKSSGEWIRTLDFGDTSALSLLNCRTNEDGAYCIDQTLWNASDDYELFRKYFFGTWEGSFHFPEYPEQERLIIDNSEKSFIMTETGIKMLDGFYETSSGALAFLIGSDSGSAIIWISLNEPDTIYMVWGGMTSPLWSRDESGAYSTAPVVYTLRKTNEPLNEPENNFLSIFRLREMAHEYGIDLELLVSIDYESDGTTLYHDDWYHFYPMYLVSEAEDKIVIRTSVGSVLEKDLLPLNVTCTFEKSSGEWIRTLDFGDTSALSLLNCRTNEDDEG